MARNIKQVYDTNPSTSSTQTDLIYIGKSPYGLTDDSAILVSDFSADATHSGLVSLGTQDFPGQKNFLEAPSIRDSSAAFNVIFKTTSSPILTTTRTLTFDVSNGNRTFDLGGNLTVTADATISGTNTGDGLIVPNNIYYATGGNDTTGDGSYYHPYATQAKCNSVITPSAINIWNVVALNPAISLATFLVKPYTNYIAMYPGITKITLAGTISLDSSWEGISNAPMNIVGLDFASANTNFDFTDFSSASGQINLINVVVGNHSVTGKGNNYPSLFSNGQALTITFTDVVGGQIEENALVPTINIISDSFNSATQLYGAAEVGQINATANGGNTVELTTLQTIIDDATLDAGASGTINYTYDTASYPISSLVLTGSGGNLPDVFPYTPKAAYYIPLQRMVYVNNGGSDNPSPSRGQILNPYAGIKSATENTESNSSTVITIDGSLQSTTNLLFKPFISWWGYGINSTFIEDSSFQINLDPTWTSGGACSISNINFLNTDINFNFEGLSGSPSAILSFENISVIGVTIRSKTANPTSLYFSNSYITSTTTLSSVFARMNSCDIDDLVINTSTTGGNSTFIGTNLMINGAGNVIFSNTGGSSTTCELYTSPIPGTLTIDGTGTTVKLDAVSYPVGGIVYTSGATSAQLTLVTQIAGVNGLVSVLSGKASSGANVDITSLGGLTGAISKPTSITMATGGSFRTDTGNSNSALLQAYDVDNTTYRTFATLLAGNTPSLAIAAPSGGTVTIDGSIIGATTPANAQFLSPVNVQTGTTYTLAATDVGNIITLNNASPITLTLPQQSTITTSVGFWCHVRNLGTGLVTIVKEGAETLDGNTSIAQYAEAIIERPTTTKWSVFGGTASIIFSFEKTFQAFIGTDVRYFTVASPCAGTIIDCSQVAQSLGVAGNYTVSINGTPVTGLTTVTNTTGKTTTPATAANVFAYGDTITVTFASTVAGVNWEGTLRYTRLL